MSKTASAISMRILQTRRQRRRHPPQFEKLHAAVPVGPISMADDVGFAIKTGRFCRFRTDRRRINALDHSDENGSVLPSGSAPT